MPRERPKKSQKDQKQTNKQTKKNHEGHSLGTVIEETAGDIGLDSVQEPGLVSGSGTHIGNSKNYREGLLLLMLQEKK